MTEQWIRHIGTDSRYLEPYLGESVDFSRVTNQLSPVALKTKIY